MKNKIKVLIVDDSAIVRQALTTIFNADPDIEVIASASNPYIAVKKIKEELPDVITLDIEMPGMDGLTFLKKIMTQHPIPVVVISSLTETGSSAGVNALQAGAVEVVTKPKIHTQELLLESTVILCDAVRSAYYSKERVNRFHHIPSFYKKYSADAILPYQRSAVGGKNLDKLIAVGSSTGGPEALRYILTAMAEDCPGIVIAQHMPEAFTKSFAQRLNDLCRITVKEASHGDIITKGCAYIAPGNKHLLIEQHGSQYQIKLSDGPLVNRHRPSVDVMFRSVAQVAGHNAVGVILTGMGDDGAQGLLELKQSGAVTIAQDEETCIVFGMPKEAIELGAADIISPLHKIPSRLKSIYSCRTKLAC